MLKTILIVTTFAVVVNCFTTSRMSGRERLLESDDFNSGFHSSGFNKNLDQSSHGRGMRQTEQEQDEQWRLKGQREQERHGNGKMQEEDWRMSKIELDGRRNRMEDEMDNSEQQRSQSEESRRREMQGKHRGQMKLSGNKNNFSSQDDSNDSYEIMKVKKQYHNTDPEYARNGRMVPNHMTLRSHKLHQDNLHDSLEMANKIFKDI